MNSHVQIYTISTSSHVQICMISTNSHVQNCMIGTNSHVWIHMSHYVSLFQIRNGIVWLIVTLNCNSFDDTQMFNQLKEKSTAHVPTAHSRESSYKQHRCHKYHDYHQSNQRDCNNRLPDYHHQDNQRHDCGQRDNKDARNSKSYNKKDDRKHDHFKKTSKEAMHNDQTSSSSTGSLSGKRSWSQSPSLSCSCSCSCLSSRSYKNHHAKQHDCKPSAAPKRGCLYSNDNYDAHYHCPDKSDSVFATFSAPKAKRNNRTWK